MVASPSYGVAGFHSEGSGGIKKNPFFRQVTILKIHPALGREWFALRSIIEETRSRRPGIEMRLACW